MEQPEITPAVTAKEPMLNVPPLTLWCAVILSACFAYFQFQPGKTEQLVEALAFFPFKLSASPSRHFQTLLTYALLHFGWAHFCTNIAGLFAFGSGVERLLGKFCFMGILAGGIVLGALGHWALFPDSLAPLGGVSGGISALFGAILPLVIARRSLVAGNIVFIGTNIAVGMIGIPGEPGLAIAWQAHICGFLFGELMAFLILKRKHPASENLRDAGSS